MQPENQNQEKSVSEVLQDPNLLAPATQKLKPLKTGELKLLNAIQDKKIVDESVDRINELFRYCFLLIGLREKSFPNDLESLFLHQYLKENYGGHSIAEIKIAFEKAVKGELDLPLEDVKCYENFSVLYLASIINSFRRWASQEYRTLEKHIPPSEEDLKYLEGPKEDYHWGMMIEREYQHFLSFGQERWKLYPTGFYEQLVADGIFDQELFRKAMKIVRDGVVGNLVKEKNALALKRFPDNEPGKEAQLINDNKVKSKQIQIDEYMSGKLDGELEVISKQYCVLQFFKNAKQSMRQHVYIPAE